MHVSEPEPVWLTLIDLAHLAFRARRDLGLYIRLRMRPRLLDRKLVAMLAQPRRDWLNGERDVRTLAARYAFELSRIESIGPDRTLFALLMARTFFAWNSPQLAHDVRLAIPIRPAQDPATLDLVDFRRLLHDWIGMDIA